MPVTEWGLLVRHTRTSIVMEVTLLCSITLTRLAALPMVVARGVSLLSTLGLVRIWWNARLELVILSAPWWKPQSGQSLTEYALIVGGAGALCWVLWSTFLPSGFQLLVSVLVQLMAPAFLDSFRLE
jgi:hypothetical protein